MAGAGDPRRIAVEADSSDAARAGGFVQADNRARKIIAVAGKSATEGDARRKAGIECFAQPRAVHEAAIGKNKDVAETGSAEFFNEIFAKRPQVCAGRVSFRNASQPGFLQPQSRANDPFIIDLGIGQVPCRGYEEMVCAGKAPADLVQGIGLLQGGAQAEGQNQIGAVGRKIAGKIAPGVRGGVDGLEEFHRLGSYGNRNRITGPCEHQAPSRAPGLREIVGKEPFRRKSIVRPL